MRHGTRCPEGASGWDGAFPGDPKKIRDVKHKLYAARTPREASQLAQQEV